MVFCHQWDSGKWAGPAIAQAVFGFDKVAGTPAAFPVRLGGFEQSFAGPPVDLQKYSEHRRSLMQQIDKRQKELADQQRR